MRIDAGTFLLGILPRAGVAAGFLLFSGMVLALSGRMTGPVSAIPDSAPEQAAHLVVAPRAFLPALESWRAWNQSRGEDIHLLAVESLEPRLALPGTRSELLPRLGAVCVRRGVTTLVFAGDLPASGAAQASVGPEGTPGVRPGHPYLEAAPELTARLPGPGLRVYRAPLRSVEEAWAFVNDCRRRSATLGDLILATQGGGGSEVVRTAVEDPRAAAAGVDRGLLVHSVLDLRP